MASSSTLYNYKYTFKLIIIGDMGSGKSSLLRQFTENIFNERTNHTIGVEFGTRIIDVGNDKVKLQIWDTAGQERFKSVTKNYYRGTVGVIVLFDVTNYQSFMHAQTWINDAQDLTPPQASILLVGNKADQAAVRQVEYEQGEKLAADNGIEYIEASAKTGNNVFEVFRGIVERIQDKINNGEIDASSPALGVQLRSGLPGSGGAQSATNASSDGPSFCCH